MASLEERLETLEKENSELKQQLRSTQHSWSETTR